jgi:hypothetical protein
MMMAMLMMFTLMSDENVHTSDYDVLFVALYQMVRHLEKEAIKVEGILRVPGSVARVKVRNFHICQQMIKNKYNLICLKRSPWRQKLVAA